MDGVAVVSGGGTGIGRATARALAADRARVLILGRRVEVLEQAAGEINDELSADLVSSMRADLTDPADIEAVADHVGATFGVVDAIVNNAGGSTGLALGSLAEIAERWLDDYKLNVVSAAMLTTALSPLLRRPGGSVVVVSSMAAKSGGGGGPYGAAKGALNAWVTSLAAEYGPQGITVNSVVPGYTPDTELFGPGLPQEMHDRIVSRIALGRAGRAADVAGLIRYLVSPDACFVTGQVIDVAGGALPPSV
jgi:3-oxoacyl-[acyl-carrier protein] reductase